MDFSSLGNYGQVVDGRLYGPQNGIAGVSGMEGFGAARRNADRHHTRRVNEAARLYADVLQGRIDPVFLREAMAPRNEVFVGHLMQQYPGLYGDPGGRALGLRETMGVNDYQALYVDVLDRMYYGFYNAYPIVNKPLVRLHPLRDFRTVSRFLLDGVVTPLTAMDAAAPPPQRAMTGPVPQDGATAAAATTAPLQYSPLLYQAMTSVNWRAFVNDDLGIFKDLSNRLAIAGNRGISKFITGKFFQSTGPNTSLYAAGYRNLITTTYGAASSNPALSSQGIMDGLKVLAAMRDSGGDPIMLQGKIFLTYGSKNIAVAMNLKNQLSTFLTVEGGTAGTAQPAQMVQTTNWVMQNLELVFDPYIDIVASSALGSWALVCDPSAQNRPAVEIGMLQGYETPQIFTRLPNTQRLGGGVDPTLGDFFTMDQDMKIVTVMGGTQIDGRSTVASNGSGS